MDSWITSITYGALDDQGLDITGFDVSFTGEGLAADSREFAEAVAKVLVWPAKSHALRVRGPYPPDNSVYHFVKRFRKDGSWYIIGVDDGQTGNLWDDLLDYHIIRLTRADWPVL